MRERRRPRRGCSQPLCNPLESRCLLSTTHLAVRAAEVHALARRSKAPSIKGALTGDSLETPEDDTHIDVELQGEGPSPTLGDTLIDSQHAITITRTNSRQKFRISGGTGTLTDGQGDDISFTYSGMATEKGTTQVFSGQLKGTVSGGTGSHDGSSGSFTATASFDENAGTFSLSYALKSKSIAPMRASR
jgi:hypothetical protein